MTYTRVYLMAQGKGMRWRDRGRGYHRFMAEAPDFKQLLEVNGEPIIRRSVWQFEEAGFDPRVVARKDLLYTANVESCGLTLKYPGEDILEGVRNLMDEHPHVGTTIIAFGDVLFSNKAIEELAKAVKLHRWGCMARVEPSTVCSKKSDEVFAIWFTKDLWPDVNERIFWMLSNHGMNRPSKPWAFPFMVAPPPLHDTFRIYETGEGLKAIRDSLLVTDDYTDDIDSPEEYLRFWNDLKEAAEDEDEREE